MDTEATTLRELAVEAYEESEEEVRRVMESTARTNRSSAIRSLRDQINRQFRLHVEPEEETVVIDGLTFGVGNHYKLLQLHMPCRRCREPIPYKEMSEGLLGLGKALKEYERGTGDCLCTDCQEEEENQPFGMRSRSVPSTEEQVMIWLTALIRREIAAAVVPV